MSDAPMWRLFLSIPNAANERLTDEPFADTVVSGGKCRTTPPSFKQLRQQFEKKQGVLPCLNPHKYRNRRNKFSLHLVLFILIDKYDDRNRRMFFAASYLTRPD